MNTKLRITTGQYTDKGHKDINQDYHGLYIPDDEQLESKGIAIALADGISSSEVSQEASKSAITGFLADYYCTSEAWSVKKSAQQVLTAINSWLHAQSQRSEYRFDKDRGYVCTMSALILKSTTAHLFHVGDTRIYRLQGNSLEQLTQDHRMRIAGEKSYLSRAMGINNYLDIDYQSLHFETGDIFLLMTDGIHEFASISFMVETIKIHANELDIAAQIIASEAMKQGSNDNLTIQIVRIDETPGPDASQLYRQVNELPFPPMLDARMEFEGYRILREIHASHRSHVYLAQDKDTQTIVVLKTPSVDLQGNAAHLERFLLEEWIARRISNPHVLKPFLQKRKRNYFYNVTEYIEGVTLSQWMRDHPRPDLQTVRNIIDQIAKGLRAFHRLEMRHQDLRPKNIMIDSTGTVKIIDFGSTHVAGINEVEAPFERENLLGTALYSAPEYFLGEAGTSRSDIYSLGIITYQLLTGKFPYGMQVAKCKYAAEQKKLRYDSIRNYEPAIPIWVDEAIAKAVQVDPYKRYPELSEFIFDLFHPNRSFLNKTRPPLIERNPVLFWKSLSLLFFVIILVLLEIHFGPLK